ncbi:MAG: hypothetical protein HY999_02540 [Nitrospinae bacterium]|nr:hypothetical protein [Nitrospinota bacterium]
MNFGFLTRLKNPVGPRSDLFTTLRFNITDLSSKASMRVDTDGDGTIDYDGTSDRENETLTFTADTALNTRTIGNTLFITAIGFVYSENTRDAVEKVDVPGVVTGQYQNDEVETTNYGALLNLALEHQTFKRMKSRLGLSKPIWQKIDTETIDRDYSESGTTYQLSSTGKTETLIDLNTPVRTNVGLAFEFIDNLTLDALLQTDVLFTGTGLLSQIQETLATQVGLHYYW